MTKAAHLMMVGAREAGYKEDEDFFETPPEATEALLKVWQPNGIVWEPACGRGAISKVLTAHGMRVVSTDLVDRGFGCGGMDFLNCDVPLGESIVTNPPFNISTDFIEHACKLVPQSAFLLRVACLEGVERYRRIYSKFPLQQVLVFSKRIPRMHRPGYEGPKTTSTIAFAWFVFDDRHLGRPELGWL